MIYEITSKVLSVRTEVEPDPVFHTELTLLYIDVCQYYSRRGVIITG